MSVQIIYYKHCIRCGTHLNLTTDIPQQCISCRFQVLVNFGQVFALFLGAFIVDLLLFIICLLRMSLTATSEYTFVQHEVGVIFMRVNAKH